MTVLFAWAHGPDSAKRFLFPPHETIQTGTPGSRRRRHRQPRAAYLRALRLRGLRVVRPPCDRDPGPGVLCWPTPRIAPGASAAFSIGVNCGDPGATCFCVSMQTGPRCTTGFDIALTELDDGFTAEAGTARRPGWTVDAIDAPRGRNAEASIAVTDRAATSMGRTLETGDLPDLLYRNRDIPGGTKLRRRASRARTARWCVPRASARPHGRDLVGRDGGDALTGLGELLQRGVHLHGFGRGPVVGAVPVSPVAHAQVLVLDRPVRHQRLRGLRTLHHVVPGRHRRHRGDRRDPYDRRRGPRSRRCSRERHAVSDGVIPAGAITHVATIRQVVRHAYETNTYWVTMDDPRERQTYRFGPGQINMLGVFGVGEVPISVSSDPARPRRLAHTVRSCGRVTNVLKTLGVGDQVTLRGPFGRPWPVAKAYGGDLVSWPAASAWRRSGPPSTPRSATAARSAASSSWWAPAAPSTSCTRTRWTCGPSLRSRGIELHLTVDVADDEWPHDVGVVTALFSKVGIDLHRVTTVFTCGPEIMMRFAIRDLWRSGCRRTASG